MPAWISNHKPYKVWDEITLLNSSTVEVWEWVSNFILHIIVDLITYPRWDQS